MALFNRNKKNDSVLPEIDKYYDGERRDRAGLAWVLALVSVIAVTLIVIGLFLAGRWAYRAITDDSGEVAVVENGDEEVMPDFDGGDQPSGDTSEESTAPTETDIPTPESTPETTSPNESTGAVEAPVRTDVPSTPVTGDSPLPNTGPADVVAIFAGATTLAGGTHYIVSRKRK